MATTARTPSKPKPLQEQRAEVLPVADAPEDAPRAVEYDGESYTLPAQEDVDIDAIEAFESNQVVKGVRLLLGEPQYQKFRKNHRTMKELTEFLDVLMHVENS